MKGSFWIGIWAVIGLTVASVAYFINDYQVKHDQAIANAKTCEAAVIISGYGNVDERLIICRIPQAVVSK